MANVSASPSAADTSGAEDSWAFYQLPIFYTIQPNPPTRHKQLAMWADVLVQTAQRHCTLASKSLSDWEAGSRNTTTSTTAAPPPELRAVSSKLIGLPGDKCPFAVLYTADDDIFSNSDLQRRLPRAAVPLVFQAAMMQYPNRCISSVPLTYAMRAPGDETLFQQSAQKQSANVAKNDADGMGSWLTSVFKRTGTAATEQPTTVSSPQPKIDEGTAAPSYWLVVFANEGGHVSAMTDHVMPWVMESAGGLTTANLKKNGVITTFDEMCSENTLSYISSEGGSPIALSYIPAVGGMPDKLQASAASSSTGPLRPRTTTNSVTNEHVLRVLLYFYQHSVAAHPVARITLFNLDESERQPYEGVKFGGEEGGQ